jgi:2-phospho-L-lactate transferase/gluconeogenesis factor (CofD/UPF0052 family)
MSAFEVDVRIDRIREKYKAEYDKVLVDKKKFSPTCQIYALLSAKERRLHERTKRFIRANHMYFLKKRKHHLKVIEDKGVFGNAPVFKV